MLPPFRTPAAAGAIALAALTSLSLAGCGGSGPSATVQPPGDTPTPAAPVSAPPSALPDFAITGVRREPGGLVIPGTTVYFHVTVTNKGTASYGGFIVVQGPGNYTGGFSGLGVGETKEATVELGVHSSGGETVSNIYLRVDPDNVTPELDEANNEIGPLTVEFAGG